MTEIYTVFCGTIKDFDLRYIFVESNGAEAETPLNLRREYKPLQKNFDFPHLPVLEHIAKRIADNIDYNKLILGQLETQVGFSFEPPYEWFITSHERGKTFKLYPELQNQLTALVLEEYQRFKKPKHEKIYPKYQRAIKE